MKSFRLTFYSSLILIAGLIISSCSKKSADNPVAPKSSAKAITSFSITIGGSAIAGTITDKAIALTVPFGTSVTALAPVITISDKASVSPSSGTSQNFTNPVAYTVTAEDGTTQTYTVTISIGESSAKKITSFSFAALSPAVSAHINDTTYAITATVPATTDLTALVPTIAISANSTISPASGVVQNFTGTVSYTVTAQDGSKQIYQVTIKKAASITQTIDCSNIPTELKDLGAGIDYIVTCNLSLTGGKVLTVDPGVTIQFQGAASGITITDGAALKMLGTAAKPIVLEGTAGTAGSWTGIQIASNNTENQWQYVTVEDAGAGKYPAGLLIGDSYLADVNSGTQMVINNCTFSNNKGYGIWEYDNKYIYPRIIFSQFSSNIFKTNTYSAMNVTIDALGKLDTKSSYVNNTGNFIQVTGVDGLHNNITVQALDVPYVITNYMALHQKLTVSPGVIMEFNTDCGFVLSEGTLIANGTASSPIKFIGYNTGAGTWIGLSLGNNDPDISLKYCVIDGAGSNKPNGSTACPTDTKAALNFFPSCNSWSTLGTVSNCTISNCGGYGIIYKKGAAIVITSNIFSNNVQANVLTY